MAGKAAPSAWWGDAGGFQGLRLAGSSTDFVVPWGDAGLKGA